MLFDFNNIEDHLSVCSTLEYSKSLPNMNSDDWCNEPKVNGTIVEGNVNIYEVCTACQY